LLFLFTRLIFADLNNKSLIEHTKKLLTVNENELKALSHNYYHFAEGREYIPKEHFYANDLDIFGHASLYQYINRTGSEMGSGSLAAWLSIPAEPETILKRQEAIKELVKQSAWRRSYRPMAWQSALNWKQQHVYKLVCR
jgi:DNA mismatch repair ATPase MutS